MFLLVLCSVENRASWQCFFFCFCFFNIIGFYLWRCVKIEKKNLSHYNETIHVMRVLNMSHIVNGFYSTWGDTHAGFVHFCYKNVLNYNLIYGSIQNIDKKWPLIECYVCINFDSFAWYKKIQWMWSTNSINCVVCTWVLCDYVLSFINRSFDVDKLTWFWNWKSANHHVQQTYLDAHNGIPWSSLFVLNIWHYILHVQRIFTYIIARSVYMHTVFFMYFLKFLTAKFEILDYFFFRHCLFICYVHDAANWKSHETLSSIWSQIVHEEKKKLKHLIGFCVINIWDDCFSD